MNIDLKGKRALVCGSTQGIGKATALRLAACGASITLAARNEDSLQLVLSELEANDKQAHSFICADFDSSDVLIDKVTDFIKFYIRHEVYRSLLYCFTLEITSFMFDF